MAIRARLRRLERLAPARTTDPGNLPLEKSLAELKRVEKWLAARGYETAEEALHDGATGFESRWGNLQDIARIEQYSERLRQQAWAAIHQTGPSTGNGIV
jgi:hypothetical protein